MRLLPKDKEIGWTPYVWLIYLAYIPVQGVLDHGSPRFWAGALAGLAAFLGLYFRGHWVQGRRLLWIVAGITLLGVLSLPGNLGAMVYFIYAAAFLGGTGEAGFALRMLVLLLAVIGAEALAFHLSPFHWVPAMVLSALIGAVNIHAWQNRRANRRLLLAQEEVAHLAKVAERERIARDLHDVLGHTLSVIVLKAELASKLADRDPGRAIQEIKDVERISREALAQVRATVRGYHALSLQAEAEQVTALLEATGIAVDSSFPQVDLPPAQEGILALALREAVTNVLRHARAGACSLRLRAVAGGCELEIKDDGCGGEAREGIGLTGMRHRVEALGGSLRRDGSSGTRLVITLPTGGRP